MRLLPLQASLTLGFPPRPLQLKSHLACSLKRAREGNFERLCFRLSEATEGCPRLRPSRRHLRIRLHGPQLGPPLVVPPRLRLKHLKLRRVTHLCRNDFIKIIFTSIIGSSSHQMKTLLFSEFFRQFCGVRSAPPMSEAKPAFRMARLLFCVSLQVPR